MIFLAFAADFARCATMQFVPTAPLVYAESAGPQGLAPGLTFSRGINVNSRVSLRAEGAALACAGHANGCWTLQRSRRVQQSPGDFALSSDRIHVGPTHPTVGATQPG